jgi:hypothetical protein
MTRRWLSAWWLVAGLWVRTAHAQSIELTWEAPAPCATQAELLQRVTGMVARSNVADVSIRVVGHVAKRNDGYVLHLRLEQEGHSALRTLRDRDCTELSEAAAFLVAVAIDPTLPAVQPSATPPEAAPVDVPLATEAKEPAEAPAPAPQPQPSATATPEPVPAAEPETVAEGVVVTLHAGLFSGAWFGGLAGPHPLLGLWVGADLDALALWLSLAHQFARTRELSVPGAESRFDGQELAGTGCYLWGGQLRVGPCARLSVLRTHASVERVTETGEDDRVWATGGAALAVRYRPWKLLEFQLAGGAWVPLTSRPRFTVEGLGSVGAVGPVGAITELGVTLTWP